MLYPSLSDILGDIFFFDQNRFMIFGALLSFMIIINSWVCNIAVSNLTRAFSTSQIQTKDLYTLFRTILHSFEDVYQQPSNAFRIAIL